MNSANISSKEHFAAHQQVVLDYKLLLICENELATYTIGEKNSSSTRLVKEMITLINRIIVNKNILKENTDPDHEFLQTLTNLL